MSAFLCKTTMICQSHISNWELPSNLLSVPLVSHWSKIALSLASKPTLTMTRRDPTVPEMLYKFSKSCLAAFHRKPCSNLRIWKPYLQKGVKNVKKAGLHTKWTRQTANNEPLPQDCIECWAVVLEMELALRELPQQAAWHPNAHMLLWIRKHQELAKSTIDYVNDIHCCVPMSWPKQ